jgi:hypothetical protein
VVPAVNSGALTVYDEELLTKKGKKVNWDTRRPVIVGTYIPFHSIPFISFYSVSVQICFSSLCFALVWFHFDLTCQL